MARVREVRDTEVRRAVDRYMAGEDLLAQECPWLDVSTQRADSKEVERYLLNHLITEEERDAIMEYEIYWRKVDRSFEQKGSMP